MLEKSGNYAFIDAQNLYLGIQEQGWKLDYVRFRYYLREKYQVSRAYMFMGFLPRNQKLYEFLNKAGFRLVFKPIILAVDEPVKGNCDAELVLHSMIEYGNYEKAVIISGDGDFYCLVNYLEVQQKLAKVLAPSRCNCSLLLRKSAGSKLSLVSDLREKLEYKKSTS